jgi:outer membrane receptor protein involved in Fe transport
LLNLNAGVNFADGRYTVEVFGKNLLDEDYILDAGNTGGVFKIPTYIAGPPRFYGVRFTADF